MKVDSYMVVDFYSKKILSSHQATTRRQVASLTKIATAMVTLDWAERTGSSLYQQATVPASIAQIGGANPMGMQPGDQISLARGALRIGDRIRQCGGADTRCPCRARFVARSGRGAIR